MQGEDAPPLEREQLLAADRAPGQYQLDRKRAVYQLLEQI